MEPPSGWGRGETLEAACAGRGRRGVGVVHSGHVLSSQVRAAPWRALANEAGSLRAADGAAPDSYCVGPAERTTMALIATPRCRVTTYVMASATSSDRSRAAVAFCQVPALGAMSPALSTGWAVPGLGWTRLTRTPSSNKSWRSDSVKPWTPHW